MRLIAAMQCPSPGNYPDLYRAPMNSTCRMATGFRTDAPYSHKPSLARVKGAFSSAPRLFIDRLYRLGYLLRPYVPFFYYTIASRSLGSSPASILDVGCGEGRAISVINRHRRHYVTGVDIFRPYLEKCRGRAYHNELILCDVRFLPFKDESFDVVVCFEVLEHLEKRDGLTLIGQLERLARRQVMISTPVGFQRQGPWQGNPHEVHVSGWLPNDLKALGYKVRGTGLRHWEREGGPFMALPRRLRESKLGEVLFYAVWVAAGPISYLAPQLGGDMVGIKNLRQGGNFAAKLGPMLEP